MTPPLHLWVARDGTIRTSNHAATERLTADMLKSGKGREPFDFAMEIRRVGRCLLCDRAATIVGVLVPVDPDDAELVVRLRDYAPTLPTSQPCIAYGLCSGHALTRKTARAIEDVFRELDSQKAANL